MANSVHYSSDLGIEYPLTRLDENSSTKERILIEATLLFAQKGYSAVSIKEIAQKVGIRSASLYNHFTSKEHLWCCILEHLMDLYLIYFNRLSQAVELADSFETMLEFMFKELKEVVSIYNYYGFSMICNEQLRDEGAGDFMLNTFLKYSIEFMNRQFKICIEKGWAKEFDTNTVSTFFMHSVIIGMNMRVHENIGHEVPYNISEMYAGLQQFIQSACSQVSG